MQLRVRAYWALLPILPWMFGCGSMVASVREASDWEASEQYKSVDRHSSYPVLRRDSFEQVNLLEMIDPEKGSMVWSSWNQSSTGLDFAKQYDLALAWFRTSPLSPDEKRLRRDGVQDRILAVSTSRCNVYKTFLRRQQSDVNFGLGTATTVAGVLGAILPGVNAARNLAGTAGILSGIQAEYNQAYFSNLAAHVIVQAIELRQNRLTRELIEGRQGKGIAEYSMEAAIKDAIVIDGNCSALAGLMEAQDSIKEIQSPGLHNATHTMVRFKALQELSSKSLEEQHKSGSLDKLLALAGAKVPSLVATSVPPGAVGGGLGVALEGAADAVTRNPLDHARLQGAALGQAFAERIKAAGTPAPNALTPAAVAKAFEDQVVEKLKLKGTVGEPFASCMSELRKAAADLGAKTAERSLGAPGVAETDKLDQDIGIAQARLRWLMTQSAAVQAEARRQIDQAATTARAGLPAADKLNAFDTEALKKLMGGLALDAKKLLPTEKCG